LQELVLTCCCWAITFYTSQGEVWEGTTSFVSATTTAC